MKILRIGGYLVAGIVLSGYLFNSILGGGLLDPFLIAWSKLTPSSTNTFACSPTISLKMHVYDEVLRGNLFETGISSKLVTKTDLEIHVGSKFFLKTYDSFEYIPRHYLNNPPYETGIKKIYVFSPAIQKNFEDSHMQILDKNTKITGIIFSEDDVSSVEAMEIADCLRTNETIINESLAQYEGFFTFIHELGWLAYVTDDNSLSEPSIASDDFPEYRSYFDFHCSDGSSIEVLGKNVSIKSTNVFGNSYYNFIGNLTTSGSLLLSENSQKSLGNTYWDSLNKDTCRNKSGRVTLRQAVTPIQFVVLGE